MLFIYGSRKVFNFHSSQWESWLPQQAQSAVLGLPTGHWVMLGQNEAFNQAVMKWLKQPEAL
jgi:pimeloyl-ACP methyl ester carboxylesterase